jgi:hypothetical protein
MANLMRESEAALQRQTINDASPVFESSIQTQSVQDQNESDCRFPRGAQ